MKKRLLFIVLCFGTWWATAQYPQHDWQSINFKPSSPVLTATYFGETIFFVGGTNMALFYNNGSVIPSSAFFGSTPPPGCYEEVKASDAFEPDWWSFISNCYYGNPPNGTLYSHKYYFTSNQWNNWVGCNILAYAINLAETNAGNPFEVVDMKMFDDGCLVAANNNVNGTGHLFYATDYGINFNDPNAIGYEINGINLPAIKKICVLNQDLWLLCNNGVIISLTNPDTWSSSAGMISYNFSNTSDFYSNSIILNDIDAYDKNLIAVVSATDIYYSFNAGQNGTFQSATTNYSFADLNSIRFRHYKNGNVISATAVGNYSWHTEGSDVSKWYIETGGLPMNDRPGLVRYNENNNVLYFRYPDTYSRKQYYYADIVQGNNWISFWGFPENWPNLFNNFSGNINTVKDDFFNTYWPSSAIPFDATKAYNIDASGNFKFECWIAGFEPSQFLWTYPAGFNRHPNIRASATDVNPGFGYIPSTPTVLISNPPPAYVQPQEAYETWAATPWLFRPPENWRLYCNDNTVNQIFKNAETNGIKTDTLVPCPWTIHNFSDMYHEVDMEEFTWACLWYDTTDAFHGRINYFARPGDWLGVFYHDTCVDAHFYDYSWEFVIESFYIPVGFTPDSFDFRWYYSSHHFETKGDVNYNVINYLNWFQFHPGYPFGVLGLFPDYFYPTYIAEPNTLVYSYNIYAVTNTEFDHIVIDSFPVLIQHDTMLIDSVFLCYYDYIDECFYPDTVTNITQKAVKRMVYIGSAVDELKAAPVSVYPNPVKDYLYIKSDLNEMNIELYDVSGNKVNYWHNKTTLDFRKLKSGEYLLKVNDYSFKVMKM